MFMVCGCHSVFAGITIDPAKMVIRYESSYGFAARELAKHLKLITGADIKMNSPIVSILLQCEMFSTVVVRYYPLYTMK